METAAHIRLTTAAVAGAVLCGMAQPSAAQSPVIALRTSASIVRPGDCLRVEALALDDVAGPLSVQVTYRYSAPLVVKQEDGKETTTTRPAEVQRPPGPVMDALSRSQLHRLDDTFCVGHGAAPGPYTVDVALRPSASGAPFARLSACVMFEDPDAPAVVGGPACGFLVRGLKRAETEEVLVFDADLPSGAFYRGAIVRGGTVEAVLDGGISQTGPHELTVLVPASCAGGGMVDLVLVDQFGRASSTVPRLSVPPVR